MSRSSQSREQIRGTPLWRHSTNQKIEGLVLHGERRLRRSLMNKKRLRSAREVLRKAGNMDAYWEAVRRGRITQPYLEALETRNLPDHQEDILDAS